MTDTVRTIPPYKHFIMDVFSRDTLTNEPVLMQVMAEPVTDLNLHQLSERWCKTHDFANPLASPRMFADWLEEQGIARSALDSDPADLDPFRDRFSVMLKPRS